MVLISRKLVGIVKLLKSVRNGQRDARPTVTCQATRHRQYQITCTLLVTEAGVREQLV